MVMKNRIGEFTIYRRNLPHWNRPGAAYFITFTLRPDVGCDLTRTEIAELILATLARHEGMKYHLFEHTVMPDHVHAILVPIVAEDGTAASLARVLQGIKGYTAWRINQILGRCSAVWTRETYDRLIRSQSDYEEKAAYIFHNPSKRGLVECPEDWPWFRNGKGDDAG